MKFFVGLFIITFTLVACHSKDPSSAKTNELIEKFKPFLQGGWVPIDYVRAIEKNKSPRKSPNPGYISEMIIDTAGITDDSLHIPVAFGNHEGGDFILFFHRGHVPTSLQSNLRSGATDRDSYDLGYSVNEQDTVLILYHYRERDDKLLDKTEYIRAPSRRSDDHDLDGLQYMVNKVLMSGSYVLVDSMGSESKVVLMDDGTIFGFPGISRYEVLTDFVTEQDSAPDQIFFTGRDNNQPRYGFNFVADTINLFEPPKDYLDTLFTPGPTIYKFIKQH